MKEHSVYDGNRKLVLRFTTSENGEIEIRCVNIGYLVKIKPFANVGSGCQVSLHVRGSQGGKLIVYTYNKRGENEEYAYGTHMYKVEVE